MYKRQINDPIQLLQGKVAGLQVYNRGGDPNAQAVIRLRGISTVGANVSPLLVIDGVIGASLQNDDPADIAEINVLKDGSASAIYGSRGSSGVILVTTKTGSEGKMTLKFRDGQVELNKGEMYVVKKGIEHKPYAENECKIMIIEPNGVINTGDVEGDLTASNDVWI